MIQISVMNSGSSWSTFWARNGRIRKEIIMEVMLLTHLKKEFNKKLAEAFGREGYRVFALGNREIAGVSLLPEDHAEARDQL